MLSSDAKRKESLVLLQWIGFASRPLSPKELRIALLLDFQRPERSLHEYRNSCDFIEGYETLRDAVVARSQGLAQVVDSPTDDASNQLVQFIHQSVKDFLLDNPSQLETRPELIHHSLCSSCVRLMTFPEYADLYSNRSDDESEIFNSDDESDHLRSEGESAGGIPQSLAQYATEN